MVSLKTGKLTNKKKKTTTECADTKKEASRQLQINNAPCVIEHKQSDLGNNCSVFPEI